MLLSAFEQTDCTLVTCNFERVNLSNSVRFLFVCFLVYSQCYLVVTWLVPHETAAASVHVLCTSYNHAPVYSVTSFEATYVVCIRLMSHVCSAVTCHLHLCQNDQNLLHAADYYGNMGWNRYQNKSTQKADPGEENSTTVTQNPRPCDHEGYFLQRVRHCMIHGFLHRLAFLLFSCWHCCTPNEMYTIHEDQYEIITHTINFSKYWDHYFRHASFQ